MGAGSSTLPLMDGPYNAGVADLMLGSEGSQFDSYRFIESEPLPDPQKEHTFDHPSRLPPLFVRIFYPTDAEVFAVLKQAP